MELQISHERITVSTLAPSLSTHLSYRMPAPKTPWPHAPKHRLAESGTYFVTASTLHKHHHFRGAERLKTLHTKTGGWLNKLDSAPERQVWFNFRETRLTYQRSYFARLNYTHQNPVKHGLVPVASQYPWCSAAWFERTASAAQVQSIYRFKTDKLQVPDEYAPAREW